MFTAKRIFIVIPILWLGFVLSISFMEAWLKFQAEGVTQAIGLSIGKLVFGVLNKVELFFLITLLLCVFINSPIKKHKASKYLLFFLVLILVMQTFYLIPILDLRIEQILNKTTPQSSSMHLYYVLIEVLKTTILIMLSHKSLQNANI
ncbi:hypothetical protein ABW636_14665 [Aquimarina sp. 2201CG1-2-11]|uniref:hypothetical protein n=1 Tax=Aquimarina discodermiae TaxID=3231043 RepID=UPI0034623ACE